MIEKREASPTTLLSSSSDIEILNPMVPSYEPKALRSSPVSTNPLAQLAATCNTFCEDMRGRETQPRLPLSNSTVNNNYLLAPAELINKTSPIETNSIEYLTKIYLAATANQKARESREESEKLAAAAAYAQQHKGVDYRTCPCLSCQALRLSVLQQSTLSGLSQLTHNLPSPTSPQQHYLLPYKTPTGAISYIPVCSDAQKCSLCSPSNSPTAKSPSAYTSTSTSFTEQYLTSLAAKLTSPVSQPAPKPASPVSDGITCSWTEAGGPCGQKFASEDQLFTHIKQYHTSSSPKPASVAAAASSAPQTSVNPLTSLTNFSRKALAESSASSVMAPSQGGPVMHTSIASASRFNPYSRPVTMHRQATATLQTTPAAAAPTLPFSSLSALNSLSVAPYLFAAAR